MTPKVEELLDSAMQLSRDEREALAARLADSVEDGTAEEIDRAWREEIQRRLDDLRAGRATTVPSSEVKAKLEQMLERARPRSASTG